MYEVIQVSILIFILILKITILKHIILNNFIQLIPNIDMVVGIDIEEYRGFSSVHKKIINIIIIPYDTCNSPGSLL